ncbi:unnamed protein product [Rotaria sordida]|uniref:Transposase domain-containing protein n=1 Tax=Rotaria sordida TaxID=392033 RepID=A0A814W429_9BILA|nr:unnamed protein product [Rotaria sordida]CAF4110601.1 unnamed protein product [Rotaria sordida]
MSNKHFYRTTGSERKRKCRRQTTAIKLDSKLNEFQTNCSDSDAVEETTDEIQMPVKDFFTYSENIDYQFDDEEPLNMQHPIIESSSENEEESGDDEDDNDDIREIINLFNINRERKLYTSCNLSIYDACIEVVKLSRDLNLNKLQIQRLLNGLRLLLPSENKLPRTASGLLKIVDVNSSKKVSYYCRQCFHPLLSVQQIACTNECSLNNQRRSFKNISELVTCDVKKEILTTAKRYIDLIQEYQYESNIIFPGDLLNGQIYKNLPSNSSNNLTLMLHTDGAPVTKIGGKSLWPVQCTLVEIPPPLRDRVDSTMIFGAWLGSTHPNRDLLWAKIVEQISDLFKNGITIITNAGKRLKFSIRAQLVTFDLPALAQNCNIIQFNGYDACPDCNIHGIVIDRQVFYPHSKKPFAPKTDHDYISLATQRTTSAASKGIKGPTPLTQILIFPDQIAKDYMHLVCSGHFKTLITYWEKILLPGVFEQSSNYLISIALPHSFRYQFSPLVQYRQWKTKMFRDFLLYISPVFVSLFLPDSLAIHFLHYFVYYEHIADYYGEKSLLCTLHLHLHLKNQVLKHGALVFTSCFARESYIGQSVKWCLGKKYILEQFITWYNVDRSLALTNSIKLSNMFYIEKLNETFMDKSFIQNYQSKLIICASKKKIDLTEAIFYSRYSRGFKTFHSRAYTRAGNGVSHLVSVLNKTCPMKRKKCFGDILFYLYSHDHNYAFIRQYKCINSNISNALPTVSVPQFINDKLNSYYGFYKNKQYSYKIILVADISNKVINMKWTDDIFVYTEVVCEWEHD